MHSANDRHLLMVIAFDPLPTDVRFRPSLLLKGDTKYQGWKSLEKQGIYFSIIHHLF